MTTDSIQRFIEERQGLAGRQPLLSAMAPAEVVDAGIRAYQAIGWQLLTRTILPSLFCLGSLLFAIENLGSIFTTHQTDKLHEFGEFASKILITFGVAGPLLLIGISSISAIATCLTSDWALGNLPDGRAASKRAVQALPHLVGAAIRESLIAGSGVIVGLALLFAGQLIPDQEADTASTIVAFGIIALVVGSLVMIYFVVLHALSPAVIVLEGLRSGAAVKRSRELVSPTDRRTGASGSAALIRLAGLCFLVLMAEGASIAIADSSLNIGDQLSAFLPGTYYNAVLTTAWDIVPLFLLVWLVVPLWSIGATMIYFECRTRIEGFDIDVLAAEAWKRDKKVRFEL